MNFDIFCKKSLFLGKMALTFAYDVEKNCITYQNDRLKEEKKNCITTVDHHVSVQVQHTDNWDKKTSENIYHLLDQNIQKTLLNFHTLTCTIRAHKPHRHNTLSSSSRASVSQLGKHVHMQ